MISTAALGWYARSGRDLAFRRATDPWAILVSEVMAQQTQAARAAEAWTRFMTDFPTVTALAAASPATVIRAWRGLGYNRRALALRGAAIAIVEQHGGRVPDSLDALQRLPGVGPYTARAVLAIAYGRPVAALDVNIGRVVRRAVFGGDAPGRRELQEAADELVPDGAAAAWTHALMDIGAMFCRPGEPRCDDCPMRVACAYPGRAVDGAGEGAFVAKPRATAFEGTNRWLRGRIVDRLRDAPDGTPTTFAGSIGSHGHSAVLAALRSLDAEGLIELVDEDTAWLRIA